MEDVGELLMLQILATLITNNVRYPAEPRKIFVSMYNFLAV